LFIGLDEQPRSFSLDKIIPIPLLFIYVALAGHGYDAYQVDSIYPQSLI
jgi:hypothetical protein